MRSGVEVAGDACLDAITRALVEQACPSRVILFGSRARGDHRADSDYDLIVELPFDDDLHDTRSRLAAIVRPVAGEAEVDVWPRKPGEIEARGDDPGYMDWDIVREGIVLFARDGVPLAARPPQVREADYPSVAEWLARAAEDRRDVENNLAAGANASWSAVAFHSQQYAEKCVKAAIVRAGRRPPRTHDLAQLLAAGRTAGLDLPDLANECKALEDFAVDVRYPERVPIPSEAEARAAWAAAQAIVAVLRVAA